MTLSTFAGGKLFGSRHGEAGANVLALHGWGRSHADFNRVVEGLNAVALDLPGFGASPAPPDGWGAREYAEAIIPVLDNMELPVVVVAHSFGGRVAVHLAQQRPAAIGGLVLTGVPLLHRSGRPSKSPLKFRLGKRLHRLGLVSDDRMEELRNRFGSADYRAANGVMRNVLVRVVNESYEAQLASISCPVELVWGDDDTAAPAEIATRAETLLHDARLTIVADTDHFLPTTRPDVLRSAIDTQLERIS